MIRAICSNAPNANTALQIYKYLSSYVSVYNFSIKNKINIPQMSTTQLAICIIELLLQNKFSIFATYTFKESCANMCKLHL